jgi:rare lipoprotein A
MIKIMRYGISIAVVVSIFLLNAGCSSDGVFVKKSKTDNKTISDTASKEDYTYSESENDSKDADHGNDKKKEFASGVSYSDNSSEVNNSERTDDFYQKGNASWYGREFQGRKTASGEIFDMNKLTAAHKKLPFGTKLLVKNLDNGKTVAVTVNDRGPYRENRILDLSYAAAKKIGIVGSGEARVGIKLVKGKGEGVQSAESGDSVEGVDGSEESTCKRGETTGSSGSYSLQAGAFYSRKNAEKLQKQLEKKTENPVVMVNEDDLYKVRIDNFSSRKEAERVKKTLNSDGSISAYVVESKE